MPELIPKKPQTERSTTFDPDQFFDEWQSGEAQKLLYTNDFRKLLTTLNLCPFRNSLASENYAFTIIVSIFFIQLIQS